MFVLVSTAGVYTGKAGSGWVSEYAQEAFVMGEGEARRKADLFNGRSALTGLTWRVEAV